MNDIHAKITQLNNRALNTYLERFLFPDIEMMQLMMDKSRRLSAMNLPSSDPVMLEKEYQNLLSLVIHIETVYASDAWKTGMIVSVFCTVFILIMFLISL